MKNWCYIQGEKEYDAVNASGAILKPIPSGFVILLSNNQTTVRRRFSIAHEIGHTFFYDNSQIIPIKILPKELSKTLGDNKEEDICNSFARELLMPNELVRRSIQDIKERNLRIIIDLATKYMVSPEVAARNYC